MTCKQAIQLKIDVSGINVILYTLKNKRIRLYSKKTLKYALMPMYAYIWGALTNGVRLFMSVYSIAEEPNPSSKSNIIKGKCYNGENVLFTARTNQKALLISFVLGMFAKVA